MARDSDTSNPFPQHPAFTHPVGPDPGTVGMRNMHSAAEQRRFGTVEPLEPNLRLASYENRNSQLTRLGVPRFHVSGSGQPLKSQVAVPDSVAPTLLEAPFPERFTELVRRHRLAPLH